MKKIFVAVGSTASDAVIELAKRCRDENLDGNLARDFKYITMDTDLQVKERLEGLYTDSTRVCGIHITHEKESSPILKSLLTMRGDWEDKLEIDPYGAYGLRRKTAGTRTWVAALGQSFRNWNINLEEETLEILVVGTACGATCTGMYWDVAGWLRAHSTQSTTVCGVVCLPDLERTPIQTPDGLYPIPRNFCAFMQDMRQIAILNSLRNAYAEHCFRPLSFKEIETDASSHRWEDCRIPVYSKKDIRKDTSRLPVDAMFFLPPRVDDAKKSFVDHLFVYAAIYHFTGAGGQPNTGNAAQGGIFGGLHLAIATSPLFNAVKREVQERWQGIRSSFLAVGDKVDLDQTDQETIARLIRPSTDSFPTDLAEHIKEPKKWFKEWVDDVLEGKRPARELDEILVRLHSLIETGAIKDYMKIQPMPLRFLGRNNPTSGDSPIENATFMKKIQEDSNASWKLVARDTGIRVTLQSLKAIYLQECDKIKHWGGGSPQELEQKIKALKEAMNQAERAFESSSKTRMAKMAVKAFGQGREVQAEAADKFRTWASGWFERLAVVYLMHHLAKQLPGEERLDREIRSYTELAKQATGEVATALTYPDLKKRISVTREDVLSCLFAGMNEYDEGTDADVLKDGYLTIYDDFVSEHVKSILTKLNGDATFDKVPFTPQFTGPISGFSPVFKRSESDCTDKPGEKLVKHICKHAGAVQKPTYKTDAKDNDSFDPFASRELPSVQGEIRPADTSHSNDCYFGKLDGAPDTFLRMWLGVLALDKSLPELMGQLYSLDKRTSIQNTAMAAETSTGGRDFVRLMNLRESVEVGVVLGHLTKKMKAQTQGGIGGVHLKCKRNKQDGDNRDLVTWDQLQVSSFWDLEKNDLEATDVRTLQKLLEWLRELNVQPEARQHLKFWNEKDWIALSDETFMFDNRPEYMKALVDLENYLCDQLEVTFDPYVAG